MATIDVPYEVDRAGDSILRPGPVGEYIEVVDVDPASDQFYPPVDLDDPRLLLQDGLDPSEGNPQFHQQMVYAVGMRTIVNFETALGRVALWARFERTPGKEIRICPAAANLSARAARARTPITAPTAGVAVRLFSRQSRAIDSTAPGTLVFGCLSADIVAHEMTHALLDGYTRGYREPSNPDVGAFHEAFADICALFQHFQISDLVRREIAHRARRSGRGRAARRPRQAVRRRIEQGRAPARLPAPLGRHHLSRHLRGACARQPARVGGL